MKKRGFTLIELLAVIVVLAIIALIATPIVMNVIKEINIGAAERSAASYLKAVNTLITTEKLSGKTIADGKYTIDEEGNLEFGNVEVSGTKPSGGTIVITNGQVVNGSTIMVIGDYLCKDLDNVTCKTAENKTINSTSADVSLNDGIDLNLINYQIKGNSIQSVLPEEYQRVEYIESNGTQYIDTGVIPNQDTGFDIIFLTKNDFNTTTFGNIIGTRNSSGVDEFQISTYSNAYITQGSFRFGNVNLEAGISKGTLMNITLKNKVYSNNNGITYTLTNTFSSPSTLTVFALNQNGKKMQYGTLQLYSLKIYDGDNIIRDFVPCYQKSSGMIGLYDLEEHQFYANQGTEPFTKGADVSSTLDLDNSSEIKSVGNLITDKNNVNYGKYEIPIKIIGKNLFDTGTTNDYVIKNTLNFTVADNTISAQSSDGLATYAFNRYEYSSGKYTVSADFSGVVRHLVRCYREDGVLLTSDDITIDNWTYNDFYKGWHSRRENSVSVEIPNEVAYWNYGMVFHGTTVGEIETVSNIQIEEGLQATTYEPYKEKIYSIYLDEPLKKVGDYADYIDFANGKVVRKVATKIFDGTEEFTIPTISMDGFTPFRFLGLSNVSTPPFLSNYFVYSDKNYNYNKSECICGHGESFQMLFVISNARIPLNDIDAFKTLLSDLYNNGNPLKVLYVLENEEIIKLPNITLFEGYNKIIVDTQIKASEVSINYYNTVE